MVSECKYIDVSVSLVFWCTDMNNSAISFALPTYKSIQVDPFTFAYWTLDRVIVFHYILSFLLLLDIALNTSALYMWSLSKRRRITAVTLPTNQSTRIFWCVFESEKGIFFYFCSGSINRAPHGRIKRIKLSHDIRIFCSVNKDKKWSNSWKGVSV